MCLGPLLSLCLCIWVFSTLCIYAFVLCYLFFDVPWFSVVSFSIYLGLCCPILYLYSMPWFYYFYFCVCVCRYIFDFCFLYALVFCCIFVSGLYALVLYCLFLSELWVYLWPLFSLCLCLLLSICLWEWLGTLLPLFVSRLYALSPVVSFCLNCRFVFVLCCLFVSRLYSLVFWCLFLCVSLPIFSQQSLVCSYSYL